MDFYQLRQFLLSRQKKQQLEELEAVLHPEKEIVDGEEVYLFYDTIDESKFTFIEDSIVITQQPYESFIPLHMHEFIELNYVYQGECTVVIDHRPIQLKEGSFILIDKKTPHSVHETKKDDIVINITLKKDYLSPAFLSRLSTHSIISDFLVDFLLDSRKSNRFLLFNTGHNPKIIEIVHHIMCEYFDKGLYSDEIINSYFIILFSELIRNNEVVEKYTSQVGQSNSTLIDFLQYIEENYKDCTLTSMAEHFNFHPNYLSNLLKKGTGKSFKDLLQLQKINEAAMILMNSDLPIPEVVEEVGYSSVTFFYKKFKEIFHMTPYEFRKKNNFQ